MSLDCYKWDSQVGDVYTLFRQPLLISRETWQELGQMAESLAEELTTAESELLERPELYELLGLSPKLCEVLAETSSRGCAPCAVRTLRFDFHYTREGWRVSEVNSDVPGGYTEASCFPEFIAAYFPHTSPTGNPAKEWTAGMVSKIGEYSRVALLSAPGFLEDQQVTAFLASQLQAHGVQTFLLHSPAQLKWESGRAGVISKRGPVNLDAIVRFYQGEWLAVPRGTFLRP